MRLLTIALVLGLSVPVHAGDILRGGAGANQTPDALRPQGNVPGQIQARSNARDALARTASAIQSVQAMQNAARNAIKTAPKNLGADPNNAGATLPDVPDGLAPDGLAPYPGAIVGNTPTPSLWSGANAPTQSFAGSGRVNVTIKQTNQQAFLNWLTFNVGGKTTLTFDQSAGGTNVGKWITFNKVRDPSGSPSQIIGSIQAQGQVYIINTNGIIFGGTSQVNTHTLVASSLPINRNLIDRGLLNNPDAQFLFSALEIPAGANGTPAFDPEAPDVSFPDPLVPPYVFLPNKKIGDVTVQKGARLGAPTNASSVGGRVALIGANVQNAGTITTPDGQTILAAGLQVGFAAHNSADPSLRGLDVFVGAVTYPASILSPYAGTVTNTGFIDVARGNATLTGKDIIHNGVIRSSTSVALNGRIDLNASYDAKPNTAYQPGERPTDVPFLFSETGTVKLGANSAIEILPEWSNASKVVGSALALKSQVNIRGQAIYLGPNSTIHAPGGDVNINAGAWDLVQTSTLGSNRFVRSTGQIYLDRGALINVAGTTDAAARLEDYLLTVQLRGGELAGSPLQRDSIFRNSLGTGQSITVDLRQAGTYNGFRWVGTPLADLSGYLNLIQRTVSELTTAGGNVNLNAGSSVVMQPGSKIDVSGGWVNYSGGMVKTTRVMLGGHIFDIADAPPDRIYPSIYTGEFTKTHSRWGVSRTYTVPFMTGEHYDPAYFSGAPGGTIHISAAGVALDGTLLGQTVAGPRQERTGHAGSESDLPTPSEFSLSLTAEKFVSGIYPVYSPTPGDVIFQAGSQALAGPFALDSSGAPVALRADRLKKIILSPELFTTSGFGKVSVDNPDGRITIPRDVELKAPVQGSLTLKAANIDVFGSIIIPGGTVDATVYNISPFAASENLRDPLAASPAPSANRGIFTLGSGATISTAGLIIDDRFSNPGAFSQPVVTDGGLVSVNAYTANLSSGSLIDVSGGARMDPWGDRTYGNGGSIVIKTGQDINLQDVIGGTLTLGGTLLGRSGAEGGSLSLQALLIQVGGRALHPLTTLLQPDFFNQGGFANFTLTGLGYKTSTSGKFVPAVYIAPGTKIEPVAESYIVTPHGGSEGGLGIQVVQKPVGLRSPVSLFFEAPGVDGKENLQIRGDIVLGEGAVIRTDPLATVSFKGQTAAILGSVFAPGGTIEIAGSSNSLSLLFNDVTHALTTVYIGSRSTLSTAGTTIFYPDAFGRRNGEVLPGGTIKVSGNIVAAAGSVLDVSGTNSILDFHPTAINPQLNYVVPHSSGLTSPLYSLRTVPLRVDSDGGTIVLQGGQMLHVDSTLRGFAGGPTALGGQLFVTSGRFYLANDIPPVTDTNLVVTQSGSTIGRALPDSASAIGQAMRNTDGTFTIGRGYFSANSLLNGGFDSLTLNGVVEFKGPVTINARGFLRVADGGFINANSDVRLSAPYVFLGQNFVPPVLPEDRANQIPFTNVAATYGPGRLFVTANHIDLGTLSLQNIGKAVLTATGGDIRGNGIFNIAGDLTLRAAQIYPTTLNEFSIFAYDYSVGGANQAGRIRIEQSGTVNLPLSAGGTLSLYASVIEQFGTLRAPMGIINLGWDGTGTAPRDPITGNAKSFPITTRLTLGAGSVTSVSGVDPLTGRGILVPYGYTDGTSWYDPRGLDITGGGLPEKAVNLSAGNIDMRAGSTIDLRGGGDLLAFQWVIGNGGQVDILGQASAPWTANTSYTAGDLVTHNGNTYSARVNSQGVTPSISLFWTEVPQTYAVVPGYNPNFAPYSPFNGFTDNSISVGDRIYLTGSSALPAGYYTLLPSRYALLPGAVLVTPKSAMPIGSVQLATGASFVSGYMFNDLNQSRIVPTISQRFEVAPAAVINARAEYRTVYANDFFAAAAQRLSIDTPRLPGDSGYLLFQATQSMALQGQVLSPSIAGGRGSSIDIAAGLNFDITGAPGALVSGTVSLDSKVIGSWGAESLIIGGRRTRTTSGTTVTVLATRISVDNEGSPLSAADLTLVSKGNIIVSSGAEIRSTGTVTEAEDYLITGNGTALRVSQDLSADIIRTGVTPGGSPNLSVGAGAQLSGGSLILDSTSNMVVSPSASLKFKAYSFNAGRISLRLDNPGGLQPNPGLVLTTNFLDNLQSVQSLSLLSYSSIDLYGNGSVGNSTLGTLALNGGEIRGFNQGGGTVDITANNLVLGNKANVAKVGVVTPATGNLTFNAKTIQLAVNDLAIDQFNTVRLNATESITGVGKGSLAVQNALTLTTPLLTGAAGSQRSLSAGGTLSVVAPGGTSSATGGGLGATLGITGQNVSIGTSIALPSGSLTIRSTAGDLSITGSLNVGGTAQTFYDQTRYTDAGQITLTADVGNVNLAAGSSVNVAANNAGGNAGTLVVSAANGTFTTDGTLSGKGGTGGSNGSFTLDIKALPTLAPLAADLAAAFLNNSQSIRVHTGNVIVDGTTKVNALRLSTDAGGISVTGTIDASGETGGTISLASRGDLVLNAGSMLTVAAQTFNSAGKGGSVTLESGTQTNGSVGTGVVDIQAGSTIALSVASKVAGNAATVGSSAFNGQYSGKLHIRAPRNGAGTDLLVDAIDGTIVDASSIVVEGYKLYNLTGSGTITNAVQTDIFNDAQSFLGAAGTTTANYTNMTNRLLANNAGLSSVFVLAPGAEIINTTGNLTLGAVTSDTTADWDLSTFRFGAKSAAGVLTLRAAGNVMFYNALSDGFSPSVPSSDPTWLWLAQLTNQNTDLPVNTQSWSYRITAGADLSASDFRQVRPLDLLGSSGSLSLGKDGGTMIASGDNNALTESVISANLQSGGKGLFQVIRTGSGDIDINTGRSVQLLNQFATIYSAGTRVADATLGGTFDVSNLSQFGGTGVLGAIQQNYPMTFSVAGGNVNIKAGADIERLGVSSSRELPNNWLYRRGYVNGNGQFGQGGFGSAISSTAWWIDFSNFFQGIGALGGGDVTLQAGNNITNVDAVAPTQARVTKSQGADLAAANQLLVELGGGDVTVRAGNNIDAGIYYVERGHGVLSAGGQITTNATRSPGQIVNATGANTVLPESTWLPTTLFLGKGGFDVSARGNVLLGPVANPFLLPAGLGNSYWNKTYFSTYAPDSYVNVSSLGGSLTLRQGTYVNNVFVPMLEGWAQTQQLLGSTSSSYRQPWLRLAERSVTPFRTTVGLLPGTVRAAAYSGDINLVGNLTLSPSATGTIDLLTRGDINGLQAVGYNPNLNKTVWVSSRINVSDASPAAIPGVYSPFAYQSVPGVGTSAGQAISTQANFLSSVDQLFRETGAILGTQATQQVKQNLHAAGLLHANDPEPVRLYAGGGDISGLTLFSPKATSVLAGRDISDVAFYIQNVDEDDITVVASGRDIIPYNPNSPLRIASRTGDNIVVEGFVQAGNTPLAGDLQIGGPGVLEVLAGRNLDLGTGASNADGTGSGITSIGNARNPYLPFEGANLIVGAGLGPSISLFNSNLDFDNFISTILNGAQGTRYLSELSTSFNVNSIAAVQQLDDEKKAQVALQLFYLALRDAGRDKSLGAAGYEGGLQAIEALFGSDPWAGDIFTRERDIRTKSGGDINIFAPGGGLTLAQTVSRDSLIPPGIITEAGGSINIFTDTDVNLGVSRIFTLRGGDIMIWSSTGDIAAGASSKTVASAPPTRVLIDPTSADVTTDLAGLATGGGIGVLATVAGVPPGNVDLIAPMGVVDAGDAGIRSTGNLNIAAVSVLNASNISVAGSSVGTPAAPVVSAPNIGSLTSASSSAGASTAAATSAMPQQRKEENLTTQELPSIMTVEVLGYGGGEDDDEDEEAKRKRTQR